MSTFGPPATAALDLSSASGDDGKSYSTATIVIAVLVAIVGVIAIVAMILGIYSLTTRSGGGGGGTVGPTGPAGPIGPAGPTGPPGPGATPIFSAANTASGGNTVKLALAATYTIPGLLVGQNVCYSGSGAPIASTNCFTVAPSQVIGIKPIEGQQGYGFYNLSPADATFDLDVDFHLAYTYPSSNSPTGAELAAVIQPYLLTWNSVTNAYYPSTSFPSTTYSFQPQAPCGQVGGIFNIAYSGRFTLPANVANNPPPGFPTGCGYDTHPPLLVLVLSTGNTDANNWLASVGAGSLSVKAYQ